MEQYKVDFDSMAWQSPLDGLRFKAVKHNGRQLRLVEYRKTMEPHWCEKGHIGYVLEGRIEIEFNKHLELFNQGDGVFIPAGRKHRHMARILTETVKIIFVEDV